MNYEREKVRKTSHMSKSKRLSEHIFYVKLSYHVYGNIIFNVTSKYLQSIVKIPCTHTHIFITRFKYTGTFINSFMIGS